MTANMTPKLALPKSAMKPICGLCKSELRSDHVCPKCMIRIDPGPLGTVEAESRWGAKTTWIDYKHGAVIYARKQRALKAGVTVRWEGDVV
jgi:hypothetical protein